MSKKIAIIGTGAVAAVHAGAVNHLENAELAGVFGRNTEQAGKFAENYSCPFFSSMEEIAESRDVDFVSICTPSGYHLEPALLMAEAGKHLIIEKPLEVTPERCDTIINAARQNNVLLSCIFQNRFHPSFLKLKEAVKAGRFGKISLASGYVKWHRNQEYYETSSWKGTWKLDGGGAVMNQAIHVVDLLLWIMGEVDEVKAMGGTISHTGIEVEDTLTGALRFKSGALGTLEATTGAWPGSFKKIEICGHKGHAIIEEDTITTWVFSDGKNESAGDSTPRKGGGFSNPMDIGVQAHLQQIDDCISALEKGHAPMVSGKDGRKAVELVTRLYKNAGLR